MGGLKHSHKRISHAKPCLKPLLHYAGTKRIRHHLFTLFMIFILVDRFSHKFGFETELFKQNLDETLILHSH